MGYFDSTIYIKSQEYYRLQLMFIYSYLELFICSYANHAIIKDKFYHIIFRLILSYFCFFFLFFFFQIYAFMVITIMTSTTNTSFDNHVVHHTILKLILYCPFIEICIYSLLYKSMGYFGMWHILNKWIDKFIYLLDHIFSFQYKHAVSQIFCLYFTHLRWQSTP